MELCQLSDPGPNRVTASISHLLDIHVGALSFRVNNPTTLQDRQHGKTLNETTWREKEIQVSSDSSSLLRCMSKAILDTPNQPDCQINSLQGSQSMSCEMKESPS